VSICATFTALINKEGEMAITVKLSDKLVADAKRIAKVEHRSVPNQIEYYFQIALIAEQNPELSFSLIRQLLKADAEGGAKEYRQG
jgi:hypothetical protein